MASRNKTHQEPQSVTALDFGAHALKLAEVEHGPLGPVVRTFGVQPYLRDQRGQADLVTTLQELIRRAKAQAQNIIMVMPETDAFIMQVANPQRHAAVSEHLARTCNVWPMTQGDLLCVPKLVVDFYRDVIKTSGRRLSAVQHLPSALGRSFSQTPRTAVLHQGAESSGWYVYDRGHLIQRRTLPYGSEALTGALALAHGSERDAAEQHKRELIGDPAGWPDQSQHVMRHFLERWWQDLMAPLSERPAFIDRVVLIGGGTQLPALREFVFKQLSLVPENWRLPPHAHVAEPVRPYLEPLLPSLTDALALLVMV